MLTHKLPTPLELITQLIEVPSVSSVKPDLDMGNLEVINLLANWLETLGFNITIQPIPDHPHKANLIATLGSGEGGLVLAGHTDTVPYDQDRWKFDPFRATQSGNRLYGLGTSDMKSYLALAIAAAHHFTQKELRCPLTLLATADEESAMTGAKALVEQELNLGRYCVIGEPTNLVPARLHKGIMMEAIHLRGRSGHSSDPTLGNSAIEGMQYVIQALLNFRNELQTRFRNPVFSVPIPTLNLGHIHGGDNPNRICGECELHFDLRPLPGMDIHELRETLRQRIIESIRDLDLGCEFEALFDGIPAMETPASSSIVRLVEQITGHRSEAVAFATEGPYFTRLGMDTVILGPGDIAQAHQPDEYLTLDRIDPTLKLLKTLIQRVCVD